MAVLPLLLTALLLGAQRLLRPNAPRPRPGWLLLAGAIGIWSHPLLDLLNTYGVRLLMPFSERWYYGDALFIVDPWVWLTLLLGILLSRRLGGAAGRQGRPALAALLLFAGYAVVMAIASRAGVRAVERQAVEPASRVLASPVLANPFRRTVVRELPGRYELGRLSASPEWSYQRSEVISDGAGGAFAQAAAATPAGAAFLRWARFPRFEAVPDRGGRVRVRISDVRYGGAGGQSWASMSVQVAGGSTSP
jgi:inner membrane protein